MRKLRYDRWFDNLPEIEKDMPYFKLENGTFISPRKRLLMENENVKVKSLGGKQKVINVMSLGEQDEDNIVKQRTNKIVIELNKLGKDIPKFGYVDMSEPPVPISEIWKEIDNNSALGNEWKKVQLNAMQRYLKELEV